MPRHTVQEYLGVPANWQVKENVKFNIVLTPNAADIKRAKKKDPRACALRNAACRMFDIPNCAIGGRWAYIPQRDAKGKTYIARMQATAETQRAIRSFDRTGKMPAGGFQFIPLAESHKYKYKNDYNKKWMQDAKTKGSRPKPKRHMKHFRAIPRAFAA